MNTIKTWLPVFPGFYNTEWEPDSQLSEHCREEGIKDFKWWDHFDNGAYMLECVKACAEVLEKWLPEESGVRAIRVENVVSPKEYNFANDAANIEIDIEPLVFSAWCRDYIGQNAAQWEAWLLARYKSRDGFMSFYPHTPEEWEQDTEHFTLFDAEPDAARSRRIFPQHWPAAVLNFYFHNEREDARFELYEDASSNVYAPQFLAVPTV